MLQEDRPHSLELKSTSSTSRRGNWCSDVKMEEQDACIIKAYWSFYQIDYIAMWGEGDPPLPIIWKPCSPHALFYLKCLMLSREHKQIRNQSRSEWGGGMCGWTKEFFQKGMALFPNAVYCVVPGGGGCPFQGVLFLYVCKHFFCQLASLRARLRELQGDQKQ